LPGISELSFICPFAAAAYIMFLYVVMEQWIFWWRVWWIVKETHEIFVSVRGSEAVFCTHVFEWFILFTDICQDSEVSQNVGNSYVLKIQNSCWNFVKWCSETVRCSWNWCGIDCTLAGRWLIWFLKILSRGRSVWVLLLSI
jgi:hypothetical protein